MAESYNNIGVIHYQQGNIPLTLEYYGKSLRIREELNDKEGMATSYNNVGVIHRDQGNLSLSLEYYAKSLKIREELNDKRGIALSYNNIGLIHRDQGTLPLALEYYSKSLKIREKLNDKKGMAVSYNNIGLTQLKQGKLLAAGQNGAKSLALAQEIGYPENIKRAANLLSKVYEKQGKGMDALEMYRLEITMRDSINNEASQKASAQQQAKYEYEKEKALSDAEHQKQLAIAAEQEARQKVISYASGSVLLLVIGFLFFVFNRLKVTKQQKIEIEQQKELVDEKNKEVMDSIRYAERIQQALLKNEEYQSPHLPEHFILFKPKDIVSGDFYWALEKEGPSNSPEGGDKFLYLAAVDCTGHGVPGAFLTMLGTSFLNEINAHEKILSPAVILDELRDRVIRELSQSGKDGENNDGMDISLMRLNLKTNELQWAGANNPLWVITSNNRLSGLDPESLSNEKIASSDLSARNRNDDFELTEIKGNKQSIGFGYNMTPFTNHILQLKEKDYICIFSDGYADQFGGIKGKKYKYKTFKDKLIEICQQPMAEQKQILNTEFENWKGNLEQIDDVCVIGVRL